MDIYFIRHGQTGGNLGKRHQSEITPLTAHGHRQAQAVAEAIKKYNPTHIIESKRIRTLETGRTIASVVDMVPVSSEYFVELCRPKNMYGLKHRSLKSIVYIIKWFIGEAGGEHCDSKEGESYAAIRVRIARSQAELAALPADARVVVVSHAIFINLFLAHMCNTKPLTFFQAVTCLRNMFAIKNTSITHVRYNPEAQETKGVCTWELVSFNDTKHIPT